MSRLLWLGLGFILSPMLIVSAQVFSPPLEGELIASTPNTQDHIQLYEIQGNITRDIRIGDGVHHVWDFSPDGCQLLVTLTPDRMPSMVYSVNLNGQNARALVDISALPEGDWDMWEPTFSPDGERIALTLSRETDDGRESRVAWIPATGGTPTFYSVAGDEHTPTWSPDGQWLAYVSYEERPAGSTIFATAEPDQAEDAPRLRESDLWIVSVDGLTKERITRFDTGSANAPRWNANSNLLAFTYAPTTGANQIWMIAAQAESIPTQLNFEWVQILDLAWHPDGQRLIGSIRGLQNTTQTQLWSISLVGNADESATPYTPNGFTNPLGGDFLRYHPNGEWLALRKNYQLILLSLVTSEQLALNQFGNTPPVWSPPDFAGEAACDG